MSMTVGERILLSWGAWSEVQQEKQGGILRRIIFLCFRPGQGGWGHSRGEVHSWSTLLPTSV